MPYFTVVTLVDADGDEFPVRLEGGGYSEIAAWRNAYRKAEALIAEGRWRPRLPLTLGSIEDPDEGGRA